MRKKYCKFCRFLVYFFLPQFSLPSATALGLGGWWMNITANVGGTTNSKMDKLYFNGGIESSIVYINDALLAWGVFFPWQGVIVDWSKSNGFGYGAEAGFGPIGMDLANTKLGGWRTRFFLSIGIPTVYIGVDEHRRVQFGGLAKIPLKFCCLAN